MQNAKGKLQKIFFNRFCQPDVVIPNVQQSICSSSKTTVTHSVKWHIVRTTRRKKPEGNGEPEYRITIPWQAFIPINDPNSSCLKTPSVPLAHCHTACKFQIAPPKNAFFSHPKGACKGLCSRSSTHQDLCACFLMGKVKGNV